MHNIIGRREPYTEIGIRRLDCARCGEHRATSQWNCCANGNRWVALCTECDVALNELTLEWLGHPGAQNLMQEYKRKKLRKEE